MPDLGRRHQLEHRVDHAQARAQDRDQPDPVARAPRRPSSRAASGRRAAASARRRAPRSPAATRARGRPRGTSWARCARRAGLRACGAPPGAARRGGWARSPRVSSLVGIGGRYGPRDGRHRAVRGRANPSVPGYPRRRWPPHEGPLPRAARRAAPRVPARLAPRRRRSSSAMYETAWSKRSTAATSSRSTRPAGCSTSSATRTGSSTSGVAVKPFGLLALLRAPGDAALDLTAEELALMASSHSGEDLHVRTLQAMYRRLQVPTAALQPGVAAPLDALTAARLARDGERPNAVRHMCSGQHSVFILLREAQRLAAGRLLGAAAPRRSAPTARRSPGCSASSRTSS